MSFSYAKDDALEEIRALNVTCKDGKVAGVSNASVMPISGQDDPEITDLRNSNRGTQCGNLRLRDLGWEEYLAV